MIHLMWEEHEWSDHVYTDFSENTHYGIYQLYGDHPVYGENALLYIGKAQDQTYSARLKNHPDFNENHISTFRRIHLAYFCELDDMNYDKWKNYIDLTEKLLINAHFPAFNSQNIKSPLKSDDFPSMLVLNWGDRGRLLPEVSSLRYSYFYYDKNLEKFMTEK